MGLVSINQSIKLIKGIKRLSLDIGKLLKVEFYLLFIGPQYLARPPGTLLLAAGFYICTV